MGAGGVPSLAAGEGGEATHQTEAWIWAGEHPHVPTLPGLQGAGTERPQGWVESPSSLPVCLLVPLCGAQTPRATGPFPRPGGSQ